MATKKSYPAYLEMQPSTLVIKATRKTGRKVVQEEISFPKTEASALKEFIRWYMLSDMYDLPLAPENPWSTRLAAENPGVIHLSYTASPDEIKVIRLTTDQLNDVLTALELFP
jgi:hypothetical protein